MLSQQKQTRDNPVCGKAESDLTPLSIPVIIECGFADVSKRLSTSLLSPLIHCEAMQSRFNVFLFLLIMLVDIL